MTDTEQRTRGVSRPGSAGGARPRRRWVSRLGDLLLSLASIGGVICILAVLAALFFKVSLIMFSTGSMAPTIPTGSVAVVREIPAAEVTIGDVVTVDRPGQLPVTHRVRVVDPGPGDVRVLTLRGDANAQDDAVTYPVSTVRLVLVSVPKLAAVIVQLSDPFVLGGITVVMAALVMWAFWPRRRADESEDEDYGQDPDDGSDDSDAGNARGVIGENRTDPVASDGPGPAADGGEVTSDPMTGGGRHRAVTAAGCGAIGLMVVFGGVAAAPTARADTVERVVQGPVLRLTTVGDDAAMADLRPGVSVRWQVGVSSRAETAGTVDLSMRVDGALAAVATGLQLEVATCDSRWQGDRCAAGVRRVLASGPAQRYAGSTLSFGSMPSDEQRWLLVTAWLPVGSTAAGRSATVTVTANGVGDSVATGPGVPLPNTGVGVGVRLALFAGLVTLAAGMVLALAGRRRRETSCAA